MSGAFKMMWYTLKFSSSDSWNVLKCYIFENIPVSFKPAVR